MTLISYIVFFIIVILINVIGLMTGFHMALLYILAAAGLLMANGLRKYLVGRSGNGFRDSKKAEMLDNSVTKPANFKHEFIYNDCSDKTLLLIELPFFICIIINLILRYFFKIGL